MHALLQGEGKSRVNLLVNERRVGWLYAIKQRAVLIKSRPGFLQVMLFLSRDKRCNMQVETVDKARRL